MAYYFMGVIGLIIMMIFWVFFIKTDKPVYFIGIVIGTTMSIFGFVNLGLEFNNAKAIITAYKKGEIIEKVIYEKTNNGEIIPVDTIYIDNKWQFRLD